MTKICEKQRGMNGVAVWDPHHASRSVACAAGHSVKGTLDFYSTLTLSRKFLDYSKTGVFESVKGQFIPIVER